MVTLKRRNAPITIDLVKVSFHGTSRLYTFKTVHQLKVGDRVIVRTQKGLTLATVWSLRASFNPTIKYNWVLEKFDENKIESKFHELLKSKNIKEY